MQDTKETKKQLIQELVALRQRLAACEAFHRQHQQTADVLPESEAHFAGDIASQVGHGTTVTLRLPGAPATGGAPMHSVRQRAIKSSL
jgi:hypothetical protein